MKAVYNALSSSISLNIWQALNTGGNKKDDEERNSFVVMTAVVGLNKDGFDTISGW